MTGFFNSFDQRGKNINCIHFRRYSNHLVFVHEFSDSIILGSIYKVGGGLFLHSFENSKMTTSPYQC